MLSSSANVKKPDDTSTASHVMQSEAQADVSSHRNLLHAQPITRGP